MLETRKFRVEAAASLVTHRMYAAEGRGNGFADMHELAVYLIGEDIFDLQLVQFGDWLEQIVRAQYPDLPARDVYDPALLRAFPAMISIERPADGIKGAGDADAFIGWVNQHRAKKGIPPIQGVLVAHPTLSPQEDRS